MKSSAFARTLTNYTNTSQQSSWSGLAKVFETGRSKPVADFIGELNGLAVRAAEGSPELRGLLSEIPIMRATAEALGKAPFAEALQCLEHFVRQHPSASALAIQSALDARARSQPRRTSSRRPTTPRDPAILSGYNRRLEQALGDDSGFEEVVSDLMADRNLSAADFKQLAKLFTGRLGRNKADAVEAIKARHRNLMDARAKQRFNAGQTAA